MTHHGFGVSPGRVLAHSVGAPPALEKDRVMPYMPKVKSAIVKKVVRKRRPRGSGKFPNVAVRLPPDLTARIDRYAKEQKLSRSEALRALATLALDKLKP
jgi:Ribbon-helix-helix protein, copG family